MAGLAGALNVPGSIDALADALLPRGADSSRCQLESAQGVLLDLAMRAGLPAVTRVVDDRNTSHVIAAFAVDGIASVTALDAGYAARGPAGLLGGKDPYAVILADTEPEALVLARNGDGPGLYYARSGDGWLVGSEPVALVAAGVSAEPDVEVVREFITSGRCEDSERTFFASIWRVLPGEVVVLTAGGGVHAHERSPARRGTSTAAALIDAVSDGRVGVLLGPGLPGAALLGTALRRGDRVRPLPVHTATFPSLGSAASHTPAALVPIPFATLRHTGHTFEASDLDLDTFLADLGEPVPDLEAYLLWAIARKLGDEVDTLVDASRGEVHGIARLVDRVSARYGVLVRCPLREVGQPGGTTDAELEQIVRGTLPPAARRYAKKDSAGLVTAREFLLARQRSVAAALATARPWSDAATNVDLLRRLHAGEPVDADALLRAYLVERWLNVVNLAKAPDAARGLDDIMVRGEAWTRVPVHTEMLAPGDQVVSKLAWYVGGKLAELVQVKSYEDGLRGPWFAVLSGKVLAVSQRRVSPLWEIEPGRMARFLASVARRRLPRLSEPWTMQVALDEGGRLRVIAGTLISVVWPAWAQLWLPESAVTLFPPRANAVPPADAAVVRGPTQPDAEAAALLDALRYSLPPQLVSTLAGCAVVSADDTGSRLLGFAPGPNVEATNDPDVLVAEVFADNPAGQGADRTPIVLAFEAAGTREDPPEIVMAAPHQSGRTAEEVERR
jgi:hypothetical protein